MKKVCLIETESHHEVIRNFMCSIIEYCEVTVVTNTFCEEALRPYAHDHLTIINYEVDKFNATTVLVQGVFDYRLTITPPSWKFFRKHTEWFENSDLLIHNVNLWLYPYSNIYFFRKPNITSFKSLLKFIKYDFVNRLRRSTYTQHFNCLLAPSKELHARNKNKISSYVDLRFQYTFSKKDATSNLKIIIPGTVNSFRDYDSTIKILSDYAITAARETSVHLLGVNSSKVDYSKYDHHYFSVINYNSFIREDEYIQLFRSAHFFILPLRREIENQGILEVKGISNISGGINDAFFFGVPGMVPFFYPAENKIIYHYQNLERELIDYIENEKFLSSSTIDLTSKVAKHNLNLIHRE